MRYEKVGAPGPAGSALSIHQTRTRLFGDDCVTIWHPEPDVDGNDLATKTSADNAALLPHHLN